MQPLSLPALLSVTKISRRSGCPRSSVSSSKGRECAHVNAGRAKELDVLVTGMQRNCDTGLHEKEAHPQCASSDNASPAATCAPRPTTPQARRTAQKASGLARRGVMHVMQAKCRQHARHEAAKDGNSRQTERVVECLTPVKVRKEGTQYAESTDLNNKACSRRKWKGVVRQQSNEAEARNISKPSAEVLRRAVSRTRLEELGGRL